MSIETRHLKQTITHWPVTGSDGYGGFAFGTAVALDARWEERGELFIAPSGEEVISAVIAYTSEDVSIGDYLALGDQTTSANPSTVDGAFRIKQYSKISDLRNLRSIRKSFL